ncbi:MAG: ABC transporter ATP-binding protein [Armatimonadota bacterium]|nr:MAG: ABC transporter ATP-binding protein [Armatimonadota bacterium]
MKTLARALCYMLPYWGWQSAALACAVVVTAAGFVWPFVSMHLVDDVFLSNDAAARRLAVLYRITYWAIGATLIWSAFGLARSYLFARAGEGAAADLRRDLFRHLHTLPMKYFDRRKTGDIMSVVQNDVEALQLLYSSTLVDVITNILMAAVAIGILVWKDSRLALIALPVPVLFGITLAVFGRPLRRAGRRVREDTGKVQEVLQETISGAREVKSFGRAGSELGRFMGRVFGLVRSRVQQAVIGSGNWSVANLIAWGGMTFVVLVGGVNLIRHEEMSPGALILFINVVAMLFGPASAFVNLYTQVAGAVGAADRVFEFIDAQPEVEQEGAAELARVEGRVRFEGVSFRYGEEEPEVVRDVELDVRPGEMIALVGPSGAGKTTLVSLIARLYDVRKGRVLVDDVDVRSVTLASLRSQIAFVPQETFLFGTSVKQNIGFGREGATDEEIVAAATAANAHDFITELPKAYETEVGERGVRLSVGQKQRIAIARAILRDPRILILDEATSAQDSESERLVQEAMGRLMAGRTSFVIAHRLSTVLRANRIVVLEDGEITQVGKHAELLAEGGTYARLHALQFAAEPVVGVRDSEEHAS